MKILFNFRLLQHLALATAFVSCVSSQPNEKKPSLLEKKQTIAKPSPILESTGLQETFNLDKFDVYGFFVRLSSPGARYTSMDTQITNALAQNHKPGSINEAALAVAVLHEALLLNKTSTEQFEESDLSADTTSGNINNKQIPKETSLEIISKKRNINLKQVLVKNPLLKTYTIYALTLKALDRSYNSFDFRSPLFAALKSETKKWVALATQLKIPSEPSTTAEEPSTKDNEVQPALPYGSSGLQSDDIVLQQAQALIDKAKFKAAIDKLEKVQEDSPLYAAAQEKIREASHQAVQNLRQKASKAFQSAIPVTDVQAKMEYLKIARQHLETAINDFPEADQLSTVRENLSYINKELMGLSTEEE